MLNKEKYKNAILFFIKHFKDLDDKKLKCLLYYLDFISYRDRGKTITGDNYIKK